MPASFFDTNVLLYLISRDEKKADKVEELLAAGGTISVQVLNEIANVARRKIGLSWFDVRSFVETIEGLVKIVPITKDVHDNGIAIAERYGLSPYDAFIAAAALLAGCDRLWSEDMHDGLLIEKRLRIVNPF